MRLSAGKMETQKELFGDKKFKIIVRESASKNYARSWTYFSVNTRCVFGYSSFFFKQVEKKSVARQFIPFEWSWN